MEPRNRKQEAAGARFSEAYIVTKSGLAAETTNREEEIAGNLTTENPGIDDVRRTSEGGRYGAAAACTIDAAAR